MEAKIKAYQLVKPEILGQMVKVLNAMKEIQPCSYKQVAEFIDKEVNSVSNRMSELESVGLIKKLKGETRRSLYVVRNEVEARERQRELFQEYSIEKENLEKDIIIPNISETSYNLIKRKINYCNDKLKLLNKFKI